ncbi:hypothetical protein BC941DRAFT_476837 [Chlamydoabsidia padenii]|nr:hypothetical protein BC941DRAFT_476837 [Chlamydoabsidia padenii]
MEFLAAQAKGFQEAFVAFTRRRPADVLRYMKGCFGHFQTGVNKPAKLNEGEVPQDYDELLKYLKINSTHTLSDKTPTKYPEPSWFPYRKEQMATLIAELTPLQQTVSKLQKRVKHLEMQNIDMTPTTDPRLNMKPPSLCRTNTVNTHHQQTETQQSWSTVAKKHRPKNQARRIQSA